MTPVPPVDRRGLLAAISAFALWGVFPLFWHLLKAVPSMQIILETSVCPEALSPER